MQPVASSNIHSIGYDPGERTLRIRFCSGSTYEYPNVTPEQHQAPVNAPSIGSHFHRELRNHPNHPHRKLARAA